MRKLFLFFSFLYYAIANVYSDSITDLSTPCPCDDPTLCLPIKLRPICQQHQRTYDVVAFSLRKDQWKYYDWDIISILMWNEAPEVMCYAHKKCVQLHVKAIYEKNQTICDVETRQKWINNTIHQIQIQHADGVNIDTERPMDRETAQCQTQLLKELRDRMEASESTRHYEISFDIPWAPHGVDNRFYDFPSIAKYSEKLFIMAYDIQSQIYSHCVAQANSPLALAKSGIQEYLELSIPKEKLLLGVPWYGYRYECMELVHGKQVDYCELEASEFFGAPCSDAIGFQEEYQTIEKMITDSKLVRKWQDTTSSYWVNRIANGKQEQLWYDDIDSLKLKYQAAKDFGLSGVGMWHADCLDYSGKDQPLPKTKAMWHAIREVFGEP